MICTACPWATTASMPDSEPSQCTSALRDWSSAIPPIPPPLQTTCRVLLGCNKHRERNISSCWALHLSSLGKHCTSNRPCWADGEHSPVYSTVAKLDQRHRNLEMFPAVLAAQSSFSTQTKAKDRPRTQVHGKTKTLPPSDHPFSSLCPLKAPEGTLG